MPGRDRPDLIVELFAQPAWDRHHQLENQASIVLAWLIDRSPKVAHRLLRLWLGDFDVPDDLVIGARNQVILPSKLRPDISIDVEGRVLQLLIEVKVAGDLEDGDGHPQDEEYRRELLGLEVGEAATRAVGTLTRDASGLPDMVDLNRLRARDVEWGELRHALMTVAEEGAVGETIEAVIRSFCDAIALSIEVAKVDEEGLAEFFEMAQPAVEEIAGSLGQRVRVAPSLSNGAHYAGAKLTYEGFDDQPVVIRVFAGTAGGAMTALSEGPTLVVAVGRDHSALLKGEERSRAIEAGMKLVRTPKYAFTGLEFPLAAAVADPEAVVKDVSTAVSKARLLPQSSSPETAKRVAAVMGWEYVGHIAPPPDFTPSPSVPDTETYGPPREGQDLGGADAE